jgi:hypothetical protein
MNHESLASKLHRWTYGKSDKVNAPENATAEFQAGYKAASEAKDHDDLILNEWIRRGSPQFQDENFKEWKRGMWAFRLQDAEAKGMTPP